ncbi:uncharacterized protein [Littorina saxatilis]|uniref:uncharacterized protein n=1 Tax=Littorina saxatilis TaxID=31220 RepID=UPI0038B4EBC9
MGKRRILSFGLMFALECFDFVNDWLLYAEYMVADKGLVYGPPDEGAVWSLLGFNILGTGFFFFELINLGRELFSDEEPWMDPTVLSAIVLWFEDVPQMGINLRISACREDPRSILQLIKASLLLADVLIHIIIACFEYRKTTKTCRDEQECRQRYISWGFIILAMIITTLGAVALLFLSLTYRGTNGKIGGHQPTTDTEEQYNELGYFENVNVFLHHPDFALSTPPKSAVSEAEWIRLMSINDIRNAENQIRNFNLIHEKNDSHFKMAIYQENNEQGKWTLSGCYQMELATRAMSAVNESTCRGASFFNNRPTSMYINFYFEKPGTSVFRKHIFGEIYVNMKVFNNGQCTDVTTPPSIHYYRVNAVSNHDAKNLLMEGSRPRFYRSDTNDLQDVSQVWKTGWAQCKTSGSLAPVLDSGITVECSNTGV